MIHQVLALAAVPALAFMLFQVIALYFNIESPIVVVLSGSMKPGFERADILFVSNRAREPHRLVTGDIVVFKIADKPIPIVHRVLNVHQK